MFGWDVTLNLGVTRLTQQYYVFVVAPLAEETYRQDVVPCEWPSRVTTRALSMVLMGHYFLPRWLGLTP